MNKYQEMQERHQEKINNFPMKFAFSNEQFKKAMEELGLKETDTDKIYSFGGGGFYLKTDSEKLSKIARDFNAELRKAIDEDKDNFVFDMFDYELGNHEYVITYETEDSIEAIGLTVKEVYDNPKLLKELKRACKSQIDWYDNHREY